MLSVTYSKLIPYPFEVVLGQYYDYEHIEHVHPDTLGQYQLVSVEGDRVVYDQIWPGRRRRRSRVEQRLVSPNEIWFEFKEGRYRGTKVRSLLEARGENATQVEETYFLPGLPDWRWLERLILPNIARRVDLIWDEDLGVEVCRGGWPGLPESLATGDGPGVVEESRDEDLGWVDAIAASDIPTSGGVRVSVGGLEIALFEEDGQLYALEALCPHTGGPLALSRCRRATVTCPWHGAVFELASGRVVEGPAERGVVSYEVRCVGDRVEVAVGGRPVGSPSAAQ